MPRWPKRPVSLDTSLIEWRARQIADPVARLRFLRQAQVPVEAAAPRRSWRKAAQAGAAAVVLIGGGLWLSPLWSARSGTHARAASPVPPPPMVLTEAIPRHPEPPAAIWVVEKTKDFEVYSNGLRIENAFATTYQWRMYQRYTRTPDHTPSREWLSQPVGIVFHTTESHQAPFTAEQNSRLKRIGAGLLAFIKQNQSYHFVIDRFGRIFRVVQESDVANHAGNSVWADDQWIYVNLNNSFLGVAFEAQTVGDQSQPAVSPAQVHAGRILTQMLRARYGIATSNCVTHAQVSVNPDNMRIGYHTDWAGNFPFSEIGLGNNYDQPLASLTQFGFQHDGAFLHSAGADRWRGLQAAEAQVRRDAEAQGMAVAPYRRKLQERYRVLLAAMKTAAAEEKSNGTN